MWGLSKLNFLGKLEVLNMKECSGGLSSSELDLRGIHLVIWRTWLIWMRPRGGKNLGSNGLRRVITILSFFIKLRTQIDVAILWKK
jgi:hypothetical protein